MSDYFWPTTASASESWTYYCRVFRRCGWVCLVDGWKETTITNPDNFKTIFVFLRFEIWPIEESS